MDKLKNILAADSLVLHGKYNNDITICGRSIKSLIGSCNVSYDDSIDKNTILCLKEDNIFCIIKLGVFGYAMPISGINLLKYKKKLV